MLTILDYYQLYNKEGKVEKKCSQNNKCLRTNNDRYPQPPHSQKIISGGSQWESSKHGTRLKISRFHGARLIFLQTKKTK